MVAQLKYYTVGDGAQPSSTHGPLQNSLQFGRVKTFFDQIEKEGWKVAAGGTIEDSPGYFINPTIIDRPSDESRLVTEEQFGMFVNTSLNGFR
jgi:acyl-CoA reductase-like NAD-dependent aldehyde dehydrogenase